MDNSLFLSLNSLLRSNMYLCCQLPARAENLLSSQDQVDDNDRSLALLLIQLVIDLHSKRSRASFVNGHRWSKTELVNSEERELM